MIKKLSKLLTNRIFTVALAILLQVSWMGILLWRLSSYSKEINLAVTILSLVMVLYLVNKQINPAYKLVWTMLILTMPVFGVLIYFLFGRSNIASKMEQRFDEFKSDPIAHPEEDARIRKMLEDESLEYSNESVYIRDYAGYSLYGNVESKYFAVGDDMLSSLVEELEKAEKYIFMEYFIIADGYMWRTIRGILEEKARQGLDVRLIYDDFGCTSRLPRHFYKRLQKKGIKCASFNPLRPIVNIILNNRDHRKILVIDGKVAFTGGINIADEYINQYERFGHWKDSGLMLKGPAVWSFASMFLQMWSVITGMDPEFEKFAPPSYLTPIPEKYKGFIQPYTDIPVVSETVGENVYMNIIAHAKKYVYIYTPYLVIDNEMMTALCLTAKSGVDIRIITPEIPDKKAVFLLTQSYYEQLLEAGVRIFQYVPGFIHSKIFVCDDVVAAVGTINLDYRSLYLHFECGAWLYKCEAVEEIKADVEHTLEDCREITLDFCKNRNIAVRIFQSILRLFAPML